MDLVYKAREEKSKFRFLSIIHAVILSLGRGGVGAVNVGGQARLLRQAAQTKTKFFFSFNVMRKGWGGKKHLKLSPS